MAALETTAVQTPVFAQIKLTVSQVTKSFVTWNSKRKTRKALERLTDRELLDIGLMRQDIHSIQ